MAPAQIFARRAPVVNKKKLPDTRCTTVHSTGKMADVEHKANEKKKILREKKAEISLLAAAWNIPAYNTKTSRFIVNRANKSVRVN